MAVLINNCQCGGCVLVMEFLIRSKSSHSRIDAGGQLGVLVRGVWATFRWIPH